MKAELLEELGFPFTGLCFHDSPFAGPSSNPPPRDT